jgi:replicative DNA helicase
MGTQMENDEVIRRIMPNNQEAERSVIGSMLMDRDAIITAAEILQEEDFYSRLNGTMFQAMVDMNNADRAVDIVTFQEELKQRGVPEENRSLALIRELLEAVPTSANVRQYAGIVKDKSMLRNVIKTTEGIANECYAGTESTSDILADTEKKIFDLVKTRASGSAKPIKDVVLETLDKIMDASKSRGSVTGIPTGFKDLDYRLSGLQPSDFILIAARPSMGKTAFVLNVADHVAIREGITTVVFSLEMSNVQLVNRMLSLESGVDADKLRKGRLDVNDWEKLFEGADNIVKSHLIIEDTPGITIGEMRSKCRKLKLENNLGLIIIDYLQLMSGSGRSSDSRQQEISDISRALKQLARELNFPVVALSQLSRAVEKRDDHRPMLSDLRESGAIEQDADVVMFLYRDDYYNKDTKLKGVSEVIIAKQRNGPIGTVQLAWIAEQTKFADMPDERMKALLENADV